jgi:hypothetical protein
MLKIEKMKQVYSQTPVSIPYAPTFSVLLPSSPLMECLPVLEASRELKLNDQDTLCMSAVGM